MPRTIAPAVDNKYSVPSDTALLPALRVSGLPREAGGTAADAKEGNDALTRGPDPEGETIVVNDAELMNSLVCALSDPLSRRVFGSAIERGRTVEEIGSEQRIPSSTCYRKVRELVDRGVMIAERTMVTGGGKKLTIYRSVFRAVMAELEDGAMSVRVTINPDVADKLDVTRRTVPRRKIERRSPTRQLRVRSAK